ncbi:MAG: PQQ-binding-like beta-propeller repeat protein [Acidobacteriota bacterium]
MGTHFERQGSGLPIPLPVSRFPFSLCLALWLALSASARGQEWPQWRGHQRDGQVRDVTLPQEWPDRLSLLWKVEVGSGHSSPLVRGSRIYLHTRRGGQEVVQCLNLQDGATLWSDSYAAPYRMNSSARSHGPGPKSTPALGSDHLVTLGISGILSGYSAADGTLLWRKDPSRQFPRTSPLFGTASSPLMADGRVYVHWGGHGKGAIAALDPQSGEEQWSWEGDGPAYASPILAQWQGVRQLVTQTQQMVVGLSQASGELLWSIPFTTDYVQNSITPLIAEGRLIVSGLDNGTRSMLPVRQAGRWSLQQAWANPQVSFYMSTPVVVQGRICGLADRRAGQFVCLDASDGKVVWESPGRQGENAALLAVGQVVLGLNDVARLTVFQSTSEGLQLLKEYGVARSQTWAHPVLLQDRLLIKDREHLQLWSLKGAE